MSFDGIVAASIVRYPYLWAREAAQGETEGRKLRPAAVVIRLPRENGDLLLLLPITSKEPDRSRFAIEIPQIEKRRAGLDADVRLWVVLDEYNLDIVGQSYYLEPEPPLGHFSKAFFLPLLKQFLALRTKSRSVDRV
ncbi:hypothetical protein D3874_08355 [Oleomonas cavernae]|uniref:Growth inhibitor PemK n=1 Tax=Oleomonas cavernae TaxID=2320859 RepID=A0A418WAF0_9PROT|nr:hypothetical protein [Oleomonas cavernae]RJF87031.1 hypothetical protein D3874_08355 [Oleomonas cavernae]